MKILLIARHLNTFDGTGRYTASIATHLTSLGHEVSAIVHTPSDIGVSEHLLLDRPQEYMSNVISVLRSAQKVSSVIRKWRPDIVHVTTEPYGHMLPFLPREVPTVLTIHGTYAFIPHLIKSLHKRILAQWLTARMYKQADAIVSVSCFTKRHALSFMSNKMDIDRKIEVIYSGVESVSNSKTCARHTFSNPTSPTILFVGSVIPRKNLLGAVRALERYHQNFKEKPRLVAVGSLERDPHYVNTVRDFVRKHKMDDYVFLVGKISDQDLDEYYRRGDIFLMPSVNSGTDFEGFGLVYIEANSWGLPALGARNSGAEEAIQNGETGYIIDPNDPEDIAEKLNFLVTDSGRYAEMSEKACACAMRLSWDNQIRRYLCLYQALSEREE